MTSSAENLSNVGAFRPLQNPKYTTFCTVLYQRLDGSACHLALHGSYTWSRIPLKMGHHGGSSGPNVNSFLTWLLDSENLATAFAYFLRRFHTARKGTKFAGLCWTSNDQNAFSSRGLHLGALPQTPVIGSRSRAHYVAPPKRNSWIRY